MFEKVIFKRNIGGPGPTKHILHTLAVPLANSFGPYAMRATRPLKYRYNTYRHLLYLSNSCVFSTEEIYCIQPDSDF